MKRLVYSYLANVNIENTSWEILIDELVSVFDLPKSHAKYLTRTYLNYFYDKKIIKKYINTRHVNESGNLGDVILPIATRVFASTVALDLVSVQPLESPKVNMIYMDTVYGEPKLNLFQKIIAGIKKLIIFVKNIRYAKKI